MGGQAVRQSGGRWLRLAVGLGGAVLLTAPPADRLSAQVGYDPSHSPFHDVRRGAGLRFAASCPTSAARSASPSAARSPRTRAATASALSSPSLQAPACGGTRRDASPCKPTRAPCCGS